MFEATKIDDLKLAELKATHGRIWVITAEYAGEETEVACKLPTSQAIKRFGIQGKAGNELDAQDGFFADLVVYPDAAQLADDAYPVVPQVVGAMVEVLGLGHKAKTKKA